MQYVLTQIARGKAGHHQLASVMNVRLQCRKMTHSEDMRGLWVICPKKKLKTV